MSDPSSILLGSTEETRGQDNSEQPKGKPGAKPRASRAGTRSVSTLNAEQLARKRANDREAQRAIRQRTREHVGRLEKRIKELSGDDDDPDSDPALAEVQRRNSELEEELRILRESLHISEDGTSPPELTYSNPGYGAPSAGEPSSLSYPFPWASQNAGIGPTAFAPISAPNPGPEAPWASQVATYEGHRVSNPHPGFGQAGPSSNSERISLSLEYGSDFGSNDGGRGDDHLIPYHIEHIQVVNPNPPHQISRNIPFRGGRPESLWPVPGIIPALSGNHAGMGSSAMIAGPDPTTHGMNSSFINQPSLHVWEFPIRISQPASLSETLIVRVVQQLRTLRTEGVTGTALIGPRQASLGPLLQPGHPRQVHPIMLTISEMVRVAPFPGFAEKIGATVVIYPVFQWLVAHLRETHTGLPGYYAPRPSQLNTHHPIWISFVGWPRLRDAIIANQETYANEEFEYLYTASINLNWPYREQGIVEQVGDDWRVTAAFMAHAMKLESWSLDEPFQRRYPELRDTCKFTEYAVRAQE